MQFENGALKITNNICALCNDEFDNFVNHLVVKNHINHQVLTKEFCSALALNSNLISSQSLPCSIPSLQPLIYYLKSQKLPLYFKQLYTCHKCLLIFDSIHILFSHLNKCDSIKSESEDETKQQQQTVNNSIPEQSNQPKQPPNENENNNKEVLAMAAHSTAHDPKVKEKMQEDDHQQGNVKENEEEMIVDQDDVDDSSDSELDSESDDLEIIAELPPAQPSPSSPQKQLCNFQELFRTVVIAEDKAGVKQLPLKNDRHNNNDDTRCVKRIEIAESRETLVLKSASFSRSLLPPKEFPSSTTNHHHSHHHHHYHHHHKNGHSPKQAALESRSNKRLLRSLNKKPEPKGAPSASPKLNKHKNKSSKHDTIILNAANRKFNKICGTFFKSLKCKFCNRSNFKHEQNLHAHYQNVHNFFPLQPQSELLLSRFTSNETTKYFSFRCLACLKMFENFTTLSQHRCKYYFRQIHIPKKDKRGKTMSKPIVSSQQAVTNNCETLPDYESENEFFKNLGLVRKNNSTFKCEHVKPKLQNISNKQNLPHKSNHKLNSNIKCMVVKPATNKTSTNQQAPSRFITTRTNSRFSNSDNRKNNKQPLAPAPTAAQQQQQQQQQLRRRARSSSGSLPDDLIISLVPTQSNTTTTTTSSPTARMMHLRTLIKP